MTNALIWIVTAIYLAQSAIFATQGNGPGAVVFAGYAVANVGLIWGFK
jgi:hypothetical protein